MLRQGLRLLQAPQRLLASEAALAARRNIEETRIGRPFAVVTVGSRQFKVTTEDLIVLRGNFNFSTGDEIAIEKVLMAGTENFSVFGRPLLTNDQVEVKARVVEKTLSNAEPYFYFVRRKDIRILRFRREALSILRITDIKLNSSMF